MMLQQMFESKLKLHNTVMNVIIKIYNSLTKNMKL